jgi:hypothetical protein
VKRVNVNIPPEVLETSRALQAANRDRLVRRERDERTRREAERQARKAREEQARSSAGGKKDPKNRGVPDVEDPPFFPLHRRGQKFKVAGAYCQVELGQLRVFTPDRQVSEVIKVPEILANQNYAFPAFVVAIPGGAGRTVLTFCFDTWDYRRFSGRLPPNSDATEKYYGFGPVTVTAVNDTIVNNDHIEPGSAITEYTRVPYQQLGGTGWYVGPQTAIFSTYTRVKRYTTADRIARRDQLLADFQNAPQVMKSCVVTNNRINVVDTPPMVSIFLKSLYPRKNPIIRIETITQTVSVTQRTDRSSLVPRVGLTTNGFDYGIIIGAPITNESGEPYSFVITDSIISSTETQVQLPSYVNETMLVEYEEDTNFYDRLLLASYGYGYLVNREPTTAAANIRASISQAISGRQSLSSIASLNSTPVQLDNRGFATPTVFAFMYKYEGEFDGNNATQGEAMDYKYISDNYFSGRLAGDDTDPGPRYMLTVGYQPEGATTDKTANLFYFRPPLDTNTFLAPPILPKEGKGADEERVMAAPPLPNMERRAFSSLWDWKLVRNMKIRGFSDSSIIQVTSSASVGEATAINTWDWGRPLACILELTALGFSEESLMLTAEEMEGKENATKADSFAFSYIPWP